MKSTGEVMGIDRNFGLAYAKSQAGAGCPLPLEGAAFFSVRDSDKPEALEVARQLSEVGFGLMATVGTAAYFAENGLQAEHVFKVNEGRPNVVDRMKNGDIHIIFNTPLGQKSEFDERAIRRNAIELGIPCITTMAGARAAAEAVTAMRSGQLSVRSLQEYHALS
jgi:carbamoyl-phosphate synthase large subunit